MSSTIFSLFSRFTQRAANTHTAPNSYAVICLWKRFFALQDEEQEEHIARIANALEEESTGSSISLVDPISSAAAVQARKEVLREFYMRQRMNMVAAVAPASSATTTANNTAASASSSSSPLSLLQTTLQSRQTEQSERLATNQARLAVPHANGDYMYYAQ